MNLVLEREAPTLHEDKIDDCYIFENHMVLLHGFIKKAQKTPKKELDLALKRKSTLEAKR